MWQSTNFCFIPISGQFSAELVCLRDSEKALRRVKAVIRKRVNHTTGRKEVEGESSPYLYFFEKITKLPLLPLQPQSTFSQTLKPKQAQLSELVRVFIMRNRIKLVFETIKYFESQELCSPDHNLDML